jgi:hypothetical protein
MRGGRTRNAWAARPLAAAFTTAIVVAATVTAANAATAAPAPCGTRAGRARPPPGPRRT